jgi:regulator of sirC expression with transglutaminase-like and TPR domain
MPYIRLLVLVAWGLLLNVAGLGAAEDKPAADPAGPEARTVEQVAEAARPSVVVITHQGRDGKKQGLGTGFVVSADGLVATNLHVIGEARPVSVRLANGKAYEVTAVHASDRSLDLALLRIDAKGLTPLPLGDSDRLKTGQPVVAVGNPFGLAHSVVAGVISGRREIDGRPMIQVAIPIETGNSGGPLLDRQGRVQGVLTMKSLVSPNLGFAMPVNALKPLLKKPNPIPMARWLTIGALDAREWKPLLGARWRLRAGRILAEGLGSGFGGRSLCLWQHPLPELPFEVAVAVRLDDEAGAAGLVFHADGGDKHYGFYPTNGQLRLTRFEGPDVLSWKILRQERSPHYRPGDWNTLKVRLAKGKIQCYVNDHLVIESDDTGLTGGRVGLAKFRDTRAEFKNFQVARKIPAAALPAAVVARVNKAVEGISPREPLKAAQVDALVPDAPASLAVLRERAKQLEEQAARLRQLALAVHHKRVQAELARLLEGKEDDIDLVHAALLLAKLDNDEVEVDVYRKEVERMAREVAASLAKGADNKAKLAALNKYLFAERGFHGSRADYYNKANSYLNEVIEDREGLPITLSVLYLELARRLGLNVVGVGLPGHFVVKHVPAEGEAQLIDVYEGGQPMSRAEAERRVRALAGRALREEDLAPVTKRAVVVRMVQNLLGIARAGKDVPAALRYLDTILAVSADAAEERWARAMLRFHVGEKQGALEDADWLLKRHPDGIDLDQVRELRNLLTRPDR